uniref:Uncharacterized protein n=1 Tax=Neogobius melanostomus TaxID=47308 RepID=A0A8C6TAI5_9GOBI
VSVSLIILTVCVCGGSAAPTNRAASSERSKLLLISFDGFRWDYDRDVDTPNLDKMAQEGVKARYVTPHTSPSPARHTSACSQVRCMSSAQFVHKLRVELPFPQPLSTAGVSP